MHSLGLEPGGEARSLGYASSPARATYTENCEDDERYLSLHTYICIVYRNNHTAIVQIGMQERLRSLTSSGAQLSMLVQKLMIMMIFLETITKKLSPVLLLSTSSNDNVNIDIINVA